MFETLFPIFVLGILTVVTVTAMIYLPEILAYKTKSNRKVAPYECGIIPVTDARGRFPVKYFLVAIDFVIFDIEAIFLFPWAIIFLDLGLYGFLAMGVFLLALILGYLYVIFKGGLVWE
jgi:NADH-quinone oxidoreductase subunit A